MDNQPSFNRDLIIPIIIGGISVIGIIVALLIGRALSSPPEIPMTPSPTPFEFILLGTEPAITTPLVQGSEVATLAEDPFEATPALTSPPSPSAPTPNILPPPGTTNTATVTVLRTNTSGGGGSPPSNSGGPQTATLTTSASAATYDDTDARFAYTGNWVSQTNVPGAHQGTLHISNTIGDRVTFTFTGNEIHLFYQAGPSLGSIYIEIDNEGGPPPFSQEQPETQTKEWVYELDSGGTHSIVIQHFSGGSVNIDSIRVPGPTPTPTLTSTPTQ